MLTVEDQLRTLEAILGKKSIKAKDKEEARANILEIRVVFSYLKRGCEKLNTLKEQLLEHQDTLRVFFNEEPSDDEVKLLQSMWDTVPASVPTGKSLKPRSKEYWENQRKKYKDWKQPVQKKEKFPQHGNKKCWDKKQTTFQKKLSKAYNKATKPVSDEKLAKLLKSLTAEIDHKREFCKFFKNKKCIPTPKDICGDCNNGDLRATKCNTLNLRKK